MKKNIDNMELEVLKTVVERNKIKNTGERIDNMVSVLKKNGVVLHHAGK